MNESSINSISNVRSAESSPPPKPQAAPTTSFTLVPQTENVPAVKPAAASPEPAQAQPEKMPSAATQIGSDANVSIHFRVDDKTSEVTIFVVDRESKKVLRSIPSSEMQKIQIGELLKLIA